jgi:hypothetical protein
MVENHARGGDVLGYYERADKVHVCFDSENPLTFEKPLTHDVGWRIVPGLDGIWRYGRGEQDIFHFSINPFTVDAG